MRILVAHNRYAQPGGEDVVAAAEAAMLLERGHEVERWTVSNEGLEEAGAAARLGAAAEAIWSRSAAHEMRARIGCFRPDVVHFHNTFPRLSTSVYAECRRAGVAVVQTLHNYRLICPKATLFRDGHECQDCVGRTVPYPGVLHGCYRGSRAQSAVVAAMLAFNWANGNYRSLVDRYIALTPSGRDLFVRGGLPADRVRVKPNFLPSDPGLGRHTGGFALFAGRLLPEKGATTLIRSWRRLKTTVPLLIAGDGPAREELEREGSGDARIRFLGWRDAVEVGRLTADAALVVVPSEWPEPFGLVVIEAFARGTPVVATIAGGLADLVQDGENGWSVPPGDVPALARAIDVALADEPERYRRGNNARRVFESLYSAESNYRQLMQVYHEARAQGGLVDSPKRVVV